MRNPLDKALPGPPSYTHVHIHIYVYMYMYILDYRHSLTYGFDDPEPEPPSVGRSKLGAQDLHLIDITVTTPKRLLVLNNPNIGWTQLKARVRRVGS